MGVGGRQGHRHRGQRHDTGHQPDEARRRREHHAAVAERQRQLPPQVPRQGDELVQRRQAGVHTEGGHELKGRRTAMRTVWSTARPAAPWIRSEAEALQLRGVSRRQWWIGSIQIGPVALEGWTGHRVARMSTVQPLSMGAQGLKMCDIVSSPRVVAAALRVGLRPGAGGANTRAGHDGASRRSPATFPASSTPIHQSLARAAARRVPSSAPSRARRSCPGAAGSWALP